MTYYLVFVCVAIHNMTSSFLLPSEPTPPLNFEPRNPRYATQEEREKSFEKWPRHMIQSKSQLVEAGFYYTGIHSELCRSILLVYP